jgi:hypothetical protein
MKWMVEISTLYFDRASKEHTEEVVNCVRDFLEKNPEIDYITVATTEGETGVLFSKQFSNKQVIVVTHHTGFKEPNKNEIEPDKKSEILANEAKILTATHAFAGVSRGIRRKVNTWTPVEMMALAYRTFGQGTKVCAEIALMAADAGLVPVDKDVVCVAGTGRGADTAWLVRPAHTNSFTNLKMRACLCKPLEF